MAQKSFSPSKKNAYGGSTDQSKKHIRGVGFTFDDMENNQSRQRKEKEKKAVLHQAYLFRPGEREPFIKGIPLLNEEGSESLFFEVKSTSIKDGKDVVNVERKDITKALSKRQPVYNGNSLVSAIFETSAKAGVLIFLDIPGSGGIRLYSQKPGCNLLIDEYRTQICYAEIRFDEEGLRQDYKKSLKDAGAGFRLPGFDGKQLSPRGIDVLYPLFDNNEARKAKVPHQHIVRLDADVECEVMFEFRHRNGIPNWFNIAVDGEGVPTAYNIRSESGPYMIEARRRKTEEEDTKKAELEARRNEF